MASILLKSQVPVPPMPRPRRGRGGRFYIDSKYKDIQDAITLDMRYCAGKHVNREQLPLRGRLKVEMDFYDSLRGDLDNKIKTVNDCLQKAGIIIDDKQIDSICATRHKQPETVNEYPLHVYVVEI